MLKPCLTFLLLLLLSTGCANTQSPVVVQLQEDSTLVVHFIDVGQADAALLIQGESSMLIDGGNVADSDLIIAYLREYNIESLDYIVCSHGHEDHVGGLSAPLATMEVGQVFSPIEEYDSNAFRNFVKYTEEQGLSLTIPAVGDVFWLGEAKITILGPLKAYEDANDISIVLRVDYGDTSFLFTGDIEREAESDLVEAGANLEADVLKVCHHGSNTSSTYPFIYAVNPSYGVISCELEGQYGHPHEEVLSRFRDADVSLYRTDLQAHIIATSNGTDISFTTGKNQDILTNPTVGNPDSTFFDGYIGNLNSKVFHLDSCTSLPQEQNQCFFQNRSDAIAEGYTACGRCNP